VKRGRGRPRKVREEPPARAEQEPKIDAEAILQLLLQPKPNPRQLQWQSFRMT
jgi:hypothetical protein